MKSRQYIGRALRRPVPSVWSFGVGFIVCVVAVMASLAVSAGAGAQGDLIGRIQSHVAEGHETLLDVARRYGLGYVEFIAANPGIDPWVPSAGTRLVVPTAHVLPDAPREGIVINLGELRLYYFSGQGGAVATYPLGVGREGWDTPVGTTRITRKRESPTWVPPKSIRELRPELPSSVPPGPDNPLGKFALDLGWPSYLIHGTNKPWGVGRRVSSGCIRLYPEDIEVLYRQVPVGTPVTVIDQPVKVGWSQGELYLEVHPTGIQVDEIEIHGRFTSDDPYFDLENKVFRTAGSEVDRLDWQTIREAARVRNGTPVRITF